MSYRDWRSNIAVVGGIAAGLVVAVWFSTVVALGPAPGGAKRSIDPPNAQQEQSARERKPVEPFLKKQDQSADKEAECAPGSQNYNDCLIQLRTARAAERQADIAWYGSLIAAVAVAFAALAAGAGLWTVLVMKWSAERQLRAYIFVEATTIVDASQLPPIPHESLPGDPHSAPKELVKGVPPSRPRGVPGASWSIKNSGLTPAHDVVHWGEMDVIETKLENTVIAPAPIEGAPRIFLGPQGVSMKSKWLPRLLTETEMQDIRIGVRAIYVYGRIDYKDAFGQRRVTTYRFRFCNAAYPPVGNPTLDYCQHGNYAD